MKIQILGTGCPKCKQLTAVAESAANELGVQFELEKITDIDKILTFGVMTTPALVIDGQIKVAGKVPSKEEIKIMLKK